MKKRAKAWISVVLALAVLLLSLEWANRIFTPKQHRSGSTWGNFLQEPRDSIDVMFFGSSVVYCGVAPAAFWETSGLTAYVNAGPEQTLAITLAYIQQSLKTQSPGVIFVECSGLGFERYQKFTKTNIGQMPWGKARIQATFHAAEPEAVKGLLFPLFFYHDRWPELTEEDFRGYNADALAGFTWMGEYTSGDLTCESLNVTEEKWQMNIESLTQIYELCRREGIELVLFRTPVERLSTPDWERLCRIMGGLDGVTMLDCLADADKIGADVSTEKYDALHFNGAGAKKFSNYLGRWTVEHLQIQPQPGQDAALWLNRLNVLNDLLRTPMRERKQAS